MTTSDILPYILKYITIYHKVFLPTHTYSQLWSTNHTVNYNVNPLLTVSVFGSRITPALFLMLA